jgi:hypothetical protein
MKPNRIYYLIVAFALTILLAAATGCKTIEKAKSVSKSSGKFRQSESTVKDTAAIAFETINTTVTEKTDTNIVLPGVSLIATGSLDSISNGHPLLFTENGVVVATSISNGVVKTDVIVPGKSVSIKKEKSTTSRINKATAAGGKTKVDKKAAGEFKQADKQSNVTVKTDVGASLQAWFWFAVVIMAILYAIYRYMNALWPFNK